MSSILMRIVKKSYDIFLFLLSELFINTLCILPRKKTNAILVCKLDAIGDYILFRNGFRSFTQSKSMIGKSIILLGNELWKELAVEWDSDIVTSFIWVNRKRFNRNLFYRFSLFYTLYKQGFGLAVETTFSREWLFGDLLIYSSFATERIASVGTNENNAHKYNAHFGDKFYTRLYPAKAEPLFEFYRNLEFFSLVANEPISVRYEIEAKHYQDFPAPIIKPYVVLVPGAQDSFRRWSDVNFSSVAKYCIENFGFAVVLCGGKSDMPVAERIEKVMNSRELTNTVGKTSLVEYVGILKCAKLVITNDTSAIHFAAAINTPFVCISNGLRLGRFHPYPKELHSMARYVFPEVVAHSLEIGDNKFLYGSQMDINIISVDEAIKSINDLLTTI